MKPLVPHEVYSANIHPEHMPLLEQFFFEDIDFYPESVRNDPDLAYYCLRIGYAYMANLAKTVNGSGIDGGLKSLGDKNFSWYINCEEINKLESPIFVCAGAGTNISFELELAYRYPHGQVYLLDPSPQSIVFIKTLKLPANLTFLEVGLAAISGDLLFTKPNVEGLGSLSAKSIVRGTETISLTVTSLPDLLASLVIKKIDYLKFDIKGANMKS